jgi:hypothetical protein
VDSNRFAALDAEVKINSAWEIIRENKKFQPMRIGYCELKKHKPWFDQAFSKLVDQRNQARLQWLQEPSEINRDNQKTVRRKASRHFGEKRNI